MLTRSEPAVDICCINEGRHLLFAEREDFCGWSTPVHTAQGSRYSLGGRGAGSSAGSQHVRYGSGNDVCGA